jgi:hypothetical protein
MQYELTGNMKPNKRSATKLAEQMSTGALVLLLVKRHKVTLLAVGNVILVLNYAIPAWPSLAASLLN